MDTKNLWYLLALAAGCVVVAAAIRKGGQQLDTILMDTLGVPEPAETPEPAELGDVNDDQDQDHDDAPAPSGPISFMGP